MVPPKGPYAAPARKLKDENRSSTIVSAELKPRWYPGSVNYLRDQTATLARWIWGRWLNRSSIIMRGGEIAASTGWPPETMVN